MEVLNSLENAIIFLSLKEKELALKYLSKSIHSVKFITYQELLNKYYFSFDEKTIAYLMEKENYHYDVARTVLNNLRYIEDKEYESPKLEKLLSLKKELIEKELLIFDPFFKDYLKRFKLYYYDEFADQFYLNLFKSLDASLIKKEKEVYQPKVYVFDEVENELEYLFVKIIETINSGVPKSKIKVAGLSDDYLYDFKRLAHLYQIAFSDEKTSLAAFKISSEYLNLLDESKSFDEALEKLGNAKEEELLKVLVNRINKVNHLELDFSKKKKIFKSLVKNTYLAKHYHDEIELLDINDLALEEDTHLFVIDFSLNKVPRTYKDEDYLKDEEKLLLALDTSHQKNKKVKSKLISLIKSHKNLYLSYSRKEDADDASVLVDELKLERIINPKIDKIYSSKLAKIKTAKYLDDLIKYDLKHPDLVAYFNSVENDYRSYSYKYSGIDNFKQEKLRLSYTSLNDYANCAFKYYVKKVLRLDEFETNFSAIIGTIYHEVLSLIFTENEDFETAWEKALALVQEELGPREKFLLKRLKKELILIIEHLKKQNAKTLFKDHLYEEEILLDLDEKLSLFGKIDKISHHRFNDEDLIALIDYKTGSFDISLKYARHGLNLQLPIYWFLVKNSKIYANPKFAGFYLQSLLHNELRAAKLKDYEKIWNDSLKLTGYSTDKHERLELLDPGFRKSDYIRSMKLNADGSFYYHAKILSDEEVLDLENLVREEVSKIGEAIFKASFEVNPKLYAKNSACTYCEFIDLCFRTSDDFIDLDKQEESSD